MTHYDNFINAKKLLLDDSIQSSLSFDLLLSEIASYFENVKADSNTGLELLRSDFVVIKNSLSLSENESLVKCDHSITSGSYIDTVNDWTGEAEQVWQETKKYTYEDMDVGRFKCTQCGLVQYYTGHWKKFFEEGTPCSGSDVCFPGGPPKDAPYHTKNTSSKEDVQTTYAISPETVKSIIAKFDFSLSIDYVYKNLKLLLTYRPYLIPGFKSLISVGKFYVQKIDYNYSLEDRVNKGVSEDLQLPAFAIQLLNLPDLKKRLEAFEQELMNTTVIVGSDFSLISLKHDLFLDIKYLFINVDYCNTTLEQAQIDSEEDARIIEDIAKRHFSELDGIFMLNYYIGESSNVLMGPIQTYQNPFGKIRG